ncbi:branched-chain amino acid transport system ATP-binding protein [Ferrithrix thermotolerans DSM 19514]|uniref:Branched-chain amino acid transport system ATP-binding protein n=1 Tax=Ferrithrix thermotolerans DSM 19514 TaxID=1121881 RepID=A0A1M4S7K6_9ACTN|nr:ABC transporter ATP-binding protein [Ferrithrix thermotolerans]SHE28017.1 branched-chain amino acid transport system ATP-binding protein [Ferrithrix thermotolerans DSM 19514]
MDSRFVLRLSNVVSGYSDLPVLWGIDLDVTENETLVVLGANGAGKSTMIKTIIGELPLKEGSIELLGEDVGKYKIHQRIGMGLAYMSELGVFPTLSIHENLMLGAYGLKRSDVRHRLEEVYSLFSELKGRKGDLASSLSGGQRKLLGIGKALMSNPKVLVMDEPSSGLSPLYVKEVIASLSTLTGTGRAMVIAEQNVSFLQLSNRVCVIEGGRVSFEGSTTEFENQEVLHKAFFGIEG